VTITAHLWSSADVIMLMMITDALRRMGNSTIYLLIPYLPYARQDRVANEGESHSLRVFCDLINSIGYSSVTVWDVHSDVALGILNRVNNVTQDCFLGSMLSNSQRPIVLVAPDAGAIKKTELLAKKHVLKYVRADKTRDTMTGNLTGAVVYSDTIGSDSFLIADDICDGGRTFLNLAKELRKLTTGQVNLYVTHGIFSAGFDAISAAFDTIYVANMKSDAGMPANFRLFPNFN
jgi:ribose-phosphate pyrophosphokinase